jgi:CBS domain-containing protein
MQHGLGNRPVERVMDKGEVFVTPDDPVEKLEQLMIEHGWGQVPVVEQGQVAGIVTRTDLIKLWVKPPYTPRREQVAARLEAALPAPLVALIRQIAATAHGMGLSIYFVGGLVRDLLLGFPIGDVDLVVEGDAIELAKELARTRGGRVKSHARFGTAKWLIADGGWRMADSEWRAGSIISHRQHARFHRFCHGPHRILFSPERIAAGGTLVHQAGFAPARLYDQHAGNLPRPGPLG